MPKRISKNQSKVKYTAKAAASGQAGQSGQSAQSDDPQSEFSVPQKWKENDEAPAASGGSPSAVQGEHTPRIEGSESSDRT